MPTKFEVGNILIAKFVSRTIVDSFLTHFIIIIIDWPYSDTFSFPDHKVIMYVLNTNFHKQLVHEDLFMHFSTMVVWTICTSPFLSAVLKPIK